MTTYREKRALWAALVCPNDDAQALRLMEDYVTHDEAVALLAEERDTTPPVVPPSPESLGQRLIAQVKASR